jgi:ribosomal protein L37AE/L43A
VLAAVRARWPKACQACGGDEIVPNFEDLTIWDCARCGAVTKQEGRDD